MTVTRLHGAGRSGFPSRQRQEISLFFKTSTASLGPIQPAIRWVKCFFPKGKAARALSWPLTPNQCLSLAWVELHLFSPYMASRRGQEQHDSLNTWLLSYKGVRRWGSIIMKTFCLYSCSLCDLKKKLRIIENRMFCWGSENECRVQNWQTTLRNTVIWHYLLLSHTEA